MWNWEDKQGISVLPRDKQSLCDLEELSFARICHFDAGYAIAELPEEIGSLAHLKYLFLGSVTHPEIHATSLKSLPRSIGLLTELEELHLQFNRLEYLPGEIGRLKNLKALKLGGNNLTCLPDEIGMLDNLQVLTLWRNNLTDIPAALCKLRGLRGLDLTGNMLLSLPKEIINLNCLTDLCLPESVEPFLNDLQKSWLKKLERNGCDIDFY